MPHQPSDLPVVIVGAGPAGAALALLLAERRVPVTLVEAARDFERQFRGEGLMPAGLDALDQLGLLPLEASIPARPLCGWSFHIEGRELFRVDEPLGGGRPCTLISQPELLRGLVERAGRCPAFRWLPGVSVSGTTTDTHGRVSGVRLADGRLLPAALVVGCDGRASTLRRRSELVLEEESSPIDLLWFRLPGHPRFVSDNVFTVLLGPGGACSVFHGARDGELHLGWVVAAGERIERSGPEWADAFAALAPTWLADHLRANADAIAPPLPLSVRVGRCRHWHRPGLLLLGDAAHPMSPIRAQGINMALRDAIVAANALVPLLHAGAQPAELDAALVRIQAEREPEIRRAQALQRAEAQQGERLRRLPPLRWLLGRLAPWLGEAIRKSWQARQHQLRQGVTTVRLLV